MKKISWLVLVILCLNAPAALAAVSRAKPPEAKPVEETKPAEKKKPLTTRLKKTAIRTTLITSLGTALAEHIALIQLSLLESRINVQQAERLAGLADQLSVISRELTKTGERQTTILQRWSEDVTNLVKAFEGGQKVEPQLEAAMGELEKALRPFEPFLETEKIKVLQKAARLLTGYGDEEVARRVAALVELYQAILVGLAWEPAREIPPAE